MPRLDTEARKLLDLRDDFNQKKLAADQAKAKAEDQQHVVFDLMRSLNQKTSGTLELGPGYGDVQLGRRETIRGRIYDLDAALDAFDNEARTDEMTKVDVRKKVLNDFVKERLETGQPLPPGVDFTRTPFIQVTRKRKK
jgi:hypothetical protein